MIEPVIQRHTGDVDAVIAYVGEIGKPQPSWRMLVPEDDVLLGSVQRPPGTDPPLQGAVNTGAGLGMAAPDLVENGHRPQAWALFNRGTTSVSQTMASGSRRRRPRGAFFCDSCRGSSHCLA